MSLWKYFELFFILIKMLLKYFLILIYLKRSITANEEVSPRKRVEFILKILKIPVGGEYEYYCPRKHATSLDRNLCFYVTSSRRTRNSSTENCLKNSQRLVEIDSNSTWNALIYTLNKTDEIRSTGEKPFHIGVVKLKNKTYVWNNSQTELLKSLMCNNKAATDLTSKLDYKCAELRISLPKLENSCINLKECNKFNNKANSICEWRGHEIEEFSVQLYKELIHSYYVIFGVIIIYYMILYLLYITYEYRMKPQHEAALKTYEYELKISNLDVTNIKIFNFN